MNTCYLSSTYIYETKSSFFIMLDTFKARLKAKLLTLGVNLSQTRIDAIADRLNKKFPDITDEAEHDGHIDEFNELQPFDEIAKVDDKVRTLESKTKDPKPDPKPADPKPDPKAADPNAELATKLSDLEKEVKEWREEKRKVKLTEALQAKMIEKKIPLSYASRFSVEKEEDIDKVVTDAETGYAELLAEIKVDPGNTKAPASSKARTTTAPDVKEVDAIIEKM